MARAGRDRKARALFAEGRKLVEAEPPQSRTNAGSFLAHLVAGRAGGCRWRLIEDVGPRRWRERIYGNIAIRLAFEHPAEAEAVLNRLEEPIWRIFAAPRICRRLARNDLARARGSPARCRIPPNAPMPGPSWPMAWRPSDRTAAAAALDRALREIDSIDAGERSRLASAEPRRLDPADRRADRARAGRRGLLAGRRADRPRRRPAHRLRPATSPLPAEALLLSRYDREAAGTLFEPVAAFVRSRPLRDANDIIPAVIVALACLDPADGRRGGRGPAGRRAPTSTTRRTGRGSPWPRSSPSRPIGDGWASGGSIPAAASRCSRRTIASCDPAVDQFGCHRRQAPTITT